jgi:hypothetical protein
MSRPLFRVGSISGRPSWSTSAPYTQHKELASPKETSKTRWVDTPKRKTIVLNVEEHILLIQNYSKDILLFQDSPLPPFSRANAVFTWLLLIISI